MEANLKKSSFSYSGFYCISRTKQRSFVEGFLHFTFHFVMSRQGKGKLTLKHLC